MYFHVIMPLGSDPNASDKRRRVESMAQEYQLAAHFPGYPPDRVTSDLEETIEELKEANFVIADLSLERPSCYYELGFAEALRKRVYLIAQLGTDIHQTANRDKVSFFNNLAGFDAVIRAILSGEMQMRSEADEASPP